MDEENEKMENGSKPKGDSAKKPARKKKKVVVVKKERRPDGAAARPAQSSSTQGQYARAADTPHDGASRAAPSITEAPAASAVSGGAASDGAASTASAAGSASPAPEAKPRPSLSITERPDVKVGCVGGRFIGPRGSRKEYEQRRPWERRGGSRFNDRSGQEGGGRFNRGGNYSGGGYSGGGGGYSGGSGGYQPRGDYHSGCGYQPRGDYHSGGGYSGGNRYGERQGGGNYGDNRGGYSGGGRYGERQGTGGGYGGGNRYGDRQGTDGNYGGGNRYGERQGGGSGENRYGDRQGGYSGGNRYGERQGGGNYGGNRFGERQGGGFQRQQGAGFQHQGAHQSGDNRGRFGGNTAQPQPAADNKGKRTYRAKKTNYYREKEDEMQEKLLQTKKRTVVMQNPVPKSIDIMEFVTISELAKKMNLKAGDLIQKLMRMGMLVTINQQIDADTATLLAAEFGAEVNIVNLYDETVIEQEEDVLDSMSPRPPVVTVMGHVDHGKTKLLDTIRSADVVSGEFGGITQHIGAYMVETPKGSITFLDTPGHEAFTRMRSRGAQVTDIVVLVVAADDGVMPQTIEAINHAKEADVPIIVAVNKIDKPEANPEKVKAQLSELGLQPEEWGGQTMFAPISALKKEGIENLIDSILLQAEILDLKANYNRRAEGKILESRIDQGRGIVASLLIEKGTLSVGDSFVAGVWPGKVRALFNDKGEKVQCATPAMPVEVLGFEGIPNAGDPLQVVEDEKTARTYSNKRQELKRFEDAKHIKKITLDNLYSTIKEDAIAELKVIIKGDVQGSVEALKSSLEELSTDEVRLNVIQALPGAINEGDVDLAVASNAILIGFNVRPTPKARALAEQEKVDIRKYNIIYRVVDEMKQALEGMLKPDTKEEIIAQVEVRNVFKISRSGTIAGCYVQSGTVKRAAQVHIIRDNIVIYSGKIASLRRFKDDVKEVAAGLECGIGIEDYEDIKEGDQFEVFEIIEIARKL